MKPLTHADLVKRADSWLRNSMGCTVTLCERGLGYERPDAIGWKTYEGVSHLVECKISRSDFCADLEKPHRREEVLGMGSYRWYMAPEGLLCPEHIPGAWGLLVIKGRTVHVAKRAVWTTKRHAPGVRNEIGLLIHNLVTPFRLIEYCEGGGI